MVLIQKFENPKKPWWRSKTLWVGVATVVLSALEYMQQIQFFKDYPQVVGIIGLAMMYLRTVTKTKLTTKK